MLDNRTIQMDFTDFEKILKGKFPEMTQEKTEKFRALEPLYKEWNMKINVISRKDIGQLYLHHVLHSLSAAEYIRQNFPAQYTGMLGGDGGAQAGSTGDTAPVSFLDLGTGGGFPGIPLAIMFPSAQFTLCDSIGKKVTVAGEVAKALRLDNVTAVNARAETLTGKYDFIVSRAVTSLDRFIPWVKGKYTRGIIYLKGGDVVEEISDAMSRCRLKPGSVSTWKIDSWLQDPYFSGKLVIFIGA